MKRKWLFCQRCGYEYNPVLIKCPVCDYEEGGNLGTCLYCQHSQCLFRTKGKCERLNPEVLDDTKHGNEELLYGQVPINPNPESTTMREFDSGATRDSDDGKPDYEGFLSPLALRRYGEYMNKHRKQADGKMRASDNWQNGIPIDTYMKSMLRHVMDLWLIQRNNKIADKQDGLEITRQEALCAILFNAFGFLHEILATKGPGCNSNES